MVYFWGRILVMNKNFIMKSHYSNFKKNLLPFLFIVLSININSQTINIHSIHALRAYGDDLGYTLNGGRMRGSRTKLLNPLNFGTNGTYKKSIKIVDDYLETESLSYISSVADIDIFFFGSFDEKTTIPFSSAELDSLYKWSMNGGKLIIATSPSPPDGHWDLDILNHHWDFESQHSSDEEYIPTRFGLNSAIFKGPFGNVVKANQGGSAQGYFKRIPSKSIVLATDNNDNPTLILDCKTLDLICIDVDGYTDLGGVTDGSDIISENDKFWANTIAYMDKIESQPKIKIEGNSLSVGEYTSYQWYFNNNLIEGAKSNSIIANKDGKYWVEVTYSNGCGTSTDTVNYIHFNKEVTSKRYFVPNVITPNGDGKNDFLIIGNIPLNSELIIFNRIGKIVYQSKNYQNNWGGKDSENNPLRYGTYWYYFKPGNDTPEITGNVFIKR